MKRITGSQSKVHFHFDSAIHFSNDNYITLHQHGYFARHNISRAESGWARGGQKHITGLDADA
jgi:hypothetical protein